MKQEHFLTHGIELVAVGEATLLKAQKRITGCAACSSSATRSFESLLSHLLGDNRTTEYFLGFPTQCPKCAAPIFERTVIDFDGKAKAALDDFKYYDVRDEEQDVVFIDEPTLMEAQSLITGCEDCSERAEIPLDQLLDAITGCDPTITEYVICHAAKCGSCHHDVMEKTLILTC